MLSSEVEALELAHQNKLNKIRDDAATTAIKIDDEVAANKVAQEEQAVTMIAQLIGQIAGENKAAAITSVLISTAVALIKAFELGPILGALSAIGIGIVSVSSLNEIQKANRGAMIGGKSHAFGGTLIEGERGEAIVNKKTMSDPYLASVVSAANVAGGGIPLAANGMLVGQAQAQSAISTMSRDVQRVLSQNPPIMILEDFHAVNNRVAIREDIGTF